MLDPDRRYRVLVVDDHDLVHWGLRMVLSGQSWVERYLKAKSSQEARELADRYRPHVALVDLFVGDESGTDISMELRRHDPRLRVLLFSGSGRLSRREREILELIASGATNREIAQRLHLSAHTVKDYTGSVYKKMAVRNRAEAVLRAQRSGLIA